jgi:hypothetical protein
MYDEIIAGYPGKSSKKLYRCPDDLICLRVCCKRGHMTKKEYSQYQKSVISGYYNNLDTIMLGKLGELVTELYLADKQAKKDRLWERVQKAMIKLKVPPAIIDHIMQKKDVEILAKNLQDWQSGKKQREK